MAMVPWESLRRRDIGLLFLKKLSIGIVMFVVGYFKNPFFFPYIGGREEL